MANIWTLPKESSIAELERLKADNKRLRDALLAVRKVVDDDPDNLNLETIVDVVWIGPTETMVDYIDAVLAQNG